MSVDIVKKESNPKDAIGTRKGRSPSSISWWVLNEVEIGMLEGAFKYGKHNYRGSGVGVRASVYMDAAINHMRRWWEGEDIDPDTYVFKDNGTLEVDERGEPIGLSHITKAICALFVLADARITGNWVDDRPPRLSPERADAHSRAMQKIVDSLFKKFPNPVPAYTEISERMKARELALEIAGKDAQVAEMVRSLSSGKGMERRNPSHGWRELKPKDHDPSHNGPEGSF